MLYFMEYNADSQGQLKDKTHNVPNDVLMTLTIVCPKSRGFFKE